jgi:phosphoglycerate kinase
MIACDIGPKTISLFEKEIRGAKQVLWNGPLGKYEDKEFKNGTMKIAEIVASSKCYSIVGGGDSVSAVNKSGKANMISHLSTGGGATMKLFEGNSLPCIEVIQEKII